MMQASYEKENIHSAQDILRESLAMTENFKAELQSRIFSKIINEKEEFELVKECEELYLKYPDLYDRFKVSLLVAKLIGAHHIKRKAAQWDIQQDGGLYLYHKFYEIREILTIGKMNDDYSKRVTSEIKNADVLYNLFDTYWLQPVRAYISSKWLVKKDGASLAEAMTKWSYLMPERFIQKVLQMYLKPRLKREISDNWDPKDTSSYLLQDWLLPWRQIFGDKEMQGFFVIIKLKITTALSE